MGFRSGNNWRATVNAMNVLLSLYRNYRISRRLMSTNPVLLYHSVDIEDLTLKHPNIHNVTRERFIRQVRAIQRRKKFLEDEEFVEENNRGTKNIACLTFDDGYLNAWNNAIPVLEELKIPSTFFINSATVLGDDFWRDRVRHLISQNLATDFVQFGGFDGQIRPEHFYRDTKDSAKVNTKEICKVMLNFFEMHEINFQSPLKFCASMDLKKIESLSYTKIGNHSHNHYVLSTLDLADQESEILTTQKWLTEHFSNGKISNVFSMPFGSVDSYNFGTLYILRKLGFRNVFTSESGPSSNPGNLNGHFEHMRIYMRFLPKEYFYFLG